MTFNTQTHSQKNFDTFKEEIWRYYANFGRKFSWRETNNPYHIIVSEIMLQQTQTYRVAPKYDFFINKFPSFEKLAESSTLDLLSAWQGLGYNRRALALQKTAQKIVCEHRSIVPQNPDILLTMPGIGKATAASICAFAFNMPTIFIETNIRAVFIHHFFPQHLVVHDNEIYPLVEQTLDRENPRLWYYALMDYGVMLKKTIINPSRKSFHHTKQTKFEGSDRQIRGKILKLLTQLHVVSHQDLLQQHNVDSERINKILQNLMDEEFITISQEKIRLRESFE